jgi:hypothetical protein
MPTLRFALTSLLGILARAGTPTGAGPAPAGGGLLRPWALFVLVDTTGTRTGHVTATEDAGGRSSRSSPPDIPQAAMACPSVSSRPASHRVSRPPGATSIPKGTSMARTPQGAHIGDLPNLEVNVRGEGRARVTAPGYTLSPGPHSIGVPGTA